jgi:hypothetical protein
MSDPKESLRSKLTSPERSNVLVCRTAPEPVSEIVHTILKGSGPPFISSTVKVSPAVIPELGVTVSTMALISALSSQTIETSAPEGGTPGPTSVQTASVP